MLHSNHVRTHTKNHTGLKCLRIRAEWLLLIILGPGELSRSDASPACSPSNICVANGHIKSEHISSVDSFSTKCISSQQVLPPATYISGDNKGATFCSELNTEDDDAHLNSSNAAPALSCLGAKVETQGNEKSASWSSSDMHQDENKLVHKRSDRNLVLPEEPHLAPKSEKMVIRIASNPIKSTREHGYER
ncbi:hypothetical protein Tco_1003247 [Tanacetum coccineum]|uniref:Uncharacterized protein n=1 Tax=Tanacetum coccineum TaxID=301880 RepID=A0ABQ5F944_9ASTR